MDFCGDSAHSVELGWAPASWCIAKEPDTNGLDPIKSAEIGIREELSKKLLSYGGLDLMVLSSKNFSIVWNSLPHQTQNLPHLSGLILVSCLRLPGIWKWGILPE